MNLTAPHQTYSGERILISPSWACLMMALLLVSAQPVRAELSAFAHAEWESLGVLPGANGRVTSVVTDEHGNVYAGGDFSVMGSAIGTRVAMWDGQRWSAVGNDAAGLPCEVNAIALMGSDLYVAGTFVRARGEPNEGIAKWDGREWTPIANAERVQRLTVMGDELYAAGAFERLNNDDELAGLARWNGNQWRGLADVEGSVNQITVEGDALYVAGASLRLDGKMVRSVARWQNEEWSFLGSGARLSSLSDLAVLDGTVFAVGPSEIAGGESGLARWDGEDWSPLEVVLPAIEQFRFEQIEIHQNQLMGVGRDDNPESPIANSCIVVAWDGESWEPLGSAFQVRWDLNVVVQGEDFYRLDNHGVDCWDGYDWTRLSEEVVTLDEPVEALEVFEDRLIAAGGITIAGNESANATAAWDGAGWTSLNGPETVPIWIETLAEWNGELYAGGQFRTADGNDSGFARWDGTTWSPIEVELAEEDHPTLAEDAPASIFMASAFAPMDEELIAIGQLNENFDFRRGIVALGKDGREWRLLDDLEANGETGFPSTMVADGKNLYAVGRFNSEDFGSWECIMQWKGDGWTSLGEYREGSATELVLLDDLLIAAGNLTEIGGQAVGGIAAWDGTSWFPLGDNGLTGSFGNLHVHEGILFATGEFSEWNGARHHPDQTSIARWDGNRWDLHFQRFPERSIWSMTVFQDHLYLGGWFQFAGNRPSGHIARLSLDAPKPGVMGVKVVEGEVSVEVQANPDAHPVLEYSSSLQPGTWQVVENTIVERLQDRFRLLDPLPADGDGYYRLTLLPQAPPTPPLFVEDFEDGVEGWTTAKISGTTEWELGTPAVPRISEARSGANVFGTDLDAKYEHNAHALLRSPLIDLTDVRMGTMSFWFISETAMIDTRDRKEGVWFRILNQKDETLFESSRVSSNWRSVGGWSEWNGPLPKKTVGKKIRIEWEFLSDDRSWNGSGFYLDDIRIDEITEGGAQLADPRRWRRGGDWMWGGD